jgi:hypothetical protein
MAEAPPQHLRAQIRAAIVALLTEVNVDVGGKVYTGRARSLVESMLPSIDVDFGLYAGRPEGGAVDTMDTSDPTRLLHRQSILTIGVNVAHRDDYLDVLDEIFADIEPAIAENNTLGGLCMRITPIGEPRVGLSAEGDQIVARGEMPFRVHYITAFNAPRQTA